MKKQTLKRQELVAMNRVLTDLGSMPGNIKFTYAIARTKSYIKDEVEAVQEATTMPESFQEYDKKRVDLCSKMADKDDDGNPIMNPSGNTFQIIKKADEFAEALEELREECKEALDDHKKWVEDLETLLNDEVDVKIHKVGIDFLPETLTANQLEVIMAMVDDGEEEEEKPKKKKKKAVEEDDDD